MYVCVNVSVGKFLEHLGALHQDPLLFCISDMPEQSEIQNEHGI